MLFVFIFLVVSLIGLGINRWASSIDDILCFMLVVSFGLFIEVIGLVGFAISTGLYLGNLFS